MEIKKNRIAEWVTCLLMLFTLPGNASMPSPTIRVVVELAEQPKPLVPTIAVPSTQHARANVNFNFNLKSIIDSPQPEIIYRVTNYSIDLHADKRDRLDLIQIAANNRGIQGIPNGFIQTTDRLDDCSATFRLETNRSCFLHYYVDKNKFTSLQGGSGPTVSIALNWLWGSHQNREGGQNLTIYADKNIANVLTPIILPTKIIVTPFEQHGLHYDAATSSIVGKPTQTGTFHFTINASIGTLTAVPQKLEITVEANQHNPPVFKRYRSLASAMPEHEYRMNLMDLIEPISSVAETNQISFRIDKNTSTWLKLDKENAALLTGTPPPSDAGQVKEVTLIATSNTGGDSLPVTIQIPVAFDPAMKPVIENGVELTGIAGATFHNDFRSHITDPTADSSLKLVIDKIEPAANWLSFSSSNPTELEGVVPQNDVGQMYQLIMHANTAIGGSSESVTIPLQIAIDESKTPQFYSDKPQLPLCYAGQPYFYDFVGSNDVIPRYLDIPYTVELAEGYNPTWVRIENNQLIIDKVPENLKQIQQIFITIKNIPGGKSKVFSIDLFIMD